MQLLVIKLPLLDTEHDVTKTHAQTAVKTANAFCKKVFIALPFLFYKLYHFDATKASVTANITHLSF